MEAKFKKGDRVIVTCSAYNNLVKVPKGATGFVNEDESSTPWVMFDISEYNYSKRGTSISIYDLELISE